MGPNTLGRLAFGLVKGRVDTIHSNITTGLYEPAGYEEDPLVRGITFHDPSVMSHEWRERAVGPAMRAAMKNIIDRATGAEAP